MAALAATFALAVMPTLAQATGGTNHSGQAGGTYGESYDQPGQSEEMKSPDQASVSKEYSKDPEIVKDVQQSLKDRGYKISKVDGKFSKDTRSAVEKFQKSQGWESTGKLDEKTLSALGVDTGTQAAGELGEGEEMGTDTSGVPSDDQAGETGEDMTQQPSDTTFPEPGMGQGQSGESDESVTQ